MFHRVVFAAFLAAVAAPSHAANFKIGAHNFTVPDGFEVTLAVPDSSVPRPIHAEFDEQGRLYVTDSSGSNDKVDKQLAEKPHRILRLADSDGDGRYEETVVFADKIMFPEGALWLNGSLYVTAPPSIWKLTDTNKDGVADKREEWFLGKTLTGCANDLHGPYFGPDGWIYWCKGAFAKQSHTLANGRPFSTRASHIFRARMDGSGVEPVLTGGMDNPVGLTFTPEGERILSCTFFQHPGGGKRDGLIHAIYGGVYGKVHDVIDEHARTGEVMPVLSHMGPAAPSDLIRYESSAFGSEYRNNLFTCAFNLHKVIRSELVENGATYKTRDTDFLSSDNPDFHPTDVIEDADGSLLVVDTGGWYKLCCPTSQLHKPDVLGGIYRVRRKGAPAIADPRGTKIDWKQSPAKLAALLGDPRPAVQRRAAQVISSHAAEAVSALSDVLSRHDAGALNAVWTLCRIDSAAARAAIWTHFGKQKPEVRHAIIHATSVWRDRSALPHLTNVQANVAEPARVRRAAAEAIGRIGDASVVPLLLDVAGRMKFEGDSDAQRVEQHAIAYALIEIGASAPLLQFVESSTKTDVRYLISLIALNAIPNSGLAPRHVTSLLSTTNIPARQTATWIASRHPEWAPALATFFAERLRAPGAATEAADLQKQLADFASHASIQEFLAKAATNVALPKESRIIAVKAMTQARPKEIAPPWSKALPTLLRDADSDIVTHAIAAARAAGKPDEPTATALRKIAERESASAELRLNAIAALAGAGTLRFSANESTLNENVFHFVRAQLGATNSAARLAAADVLGRSRLNPDQLSALARAVAACGPMETARLIPAFSRGADEKVGMELLRALQQSPSASSFSEDMIRPHLTNYPSAVQVKAAEWFKTLDVDATQAKKHLETLLGTAKGGDVRRGQSVFNSEKTACASCHAIGYLGGDAGPDLTRIGQVRTERDLLEAIVYPSASFVRSYEPVIITTRSGDDFSGVLRKDAPDEVVLVTGPNAEQRIPRDDIAEMRPGTVSVMPGGLAEQLSTQEIADLLAFLKATRW